MRLVCFHAILNVRKSRRTLSPNRVVDAVPMVPNKMPLGIILDFDHDANIIIIQIRPDFIRPLAKLTPVSKF